MQNILIYTNVDKDAGLEVTTKLVNILRITNKTVYVNYHGVCGVALKEECIELNQIPEKKIDMIIAIGGDGTILGLAREVYQYEVPIVGINLGRIGFLAEVEVADMENILSMLDTGKYDIEERVMLRAKVKSNDKELVALNDVVINRGSLSRMIELEIYVDNSCVSKYYADGVIISTPTGSTAYNLAAGGPILMPDMHIMAITPVCPHSLATRPIVASCRHTINVKLKDKIENIKERPMITVDGQEGLELQGEDEVIIVREEKAIKLIRLKSVNYYDILRKKIQ